MFCYQKNFFSPTLPVDEAQFYALVRAPKWKEDIDKYRETGDQSLKRKLPAFIFQATFDKTTSKTGKVGRWRKQVATRLTGLVVMDIDHVENPHEVFDAWLKVHDFKALGILLVYITPSGKGLKVVFKADPTKGNLIDNQHAMAAVLGVEVDESCKDASRMSFICKEEDVLHLDKELFSYENKEFGEMYDEEYRKGKSGQTRTNTEIEANTDNTDKKTNTNLPNLTNSCNSCNSCSEKNDPCSEKMYHGVPYSKIVAAWLGDKKVEQGDRHRTSLVLADHLRYITDNDPKLIEQILRETPFVKEIIEERNEDVATTVKSAQGYEFLKGFPKRMKDALKVVGAEITANCQLPTVNSNNDLNAQLTSWGEQIEALFPQFPILMDVCKGLKRNQYPAAVFVAGGLMMTLMTRCTYRFYHRPEETRRLNNSTLIIGDPASGKSFATRLYKLLTGPIMEADQVGKNAINAYREEMRTKGANKEKPKKPKVVVRIHPARTSNAQFIQDMVNAVEMVDGAPMHLHMLTFDTELDNTVSVQKGGSWIDKQSLELKAFHNEEDGQAYSNNDSIFQDFHVFWNFIYTGTPIALKKKVNEQNFGNGLATRLTCIPLPSTNFRMMDRESHVDVESDERLKECATKLDKTKGELPVQKLVDALYDWTARRMEDAAENDSRADEMLLKRCAYHGLNFSAPFIVLRHWESLHEDGQYWCGTFETDETDWQLAELLVNIQFACQRHFFGHLAEKYFDNQEHEASVNVKRQPKTFLAFERLPEEFTIEDVVRCFNLKNENAARARIKRMVDDHLVEKTNTFTENGTTKARYSKTGTFML